MTDQPEFVETVTVHNVANSVRKTLRGLIVLTVVLYVAVIGVTAWAYITSLTTRDALCVLRADLEVRAAQSQQYLDHSPTGRIADAVRQAAEGQRRTIQALSGLSC